jgi:phage shock protein A
MSDFLTRVFDMLNDLRRQTSSPMASLDRSIGAAHHAHTLARRALAIAIAEETREIERCMALASKTNDLEQRALGALRAGRDDLANEAAEAIAVMSTEINASKQASERFAAEIVLARREVDAQRRRLSELDRGRRLARVGDALTSTVNVAEAGLDSLGEAEAALAKVVANNHNARVIRQEMAPAEQLIERMADAGFGQPTHVLASEVMLRLRAAAGRPVANLIESNPEC